MALDRLGHEEIVFLPGAVNACGAQDHVGETVAYGLDEALCLELALAIGGVRFREVVLCNLLIRLLLLDGAKYAERTQVHKLVDGHLQVEQRFDQSLGSLGVDLVEVFGMQALGQAGCMHHVVEVVVGQRLLYVFLRGEIE